MRKHINTLLAATIGVGISMTGCYAVPLAPSKVLLAQAHSASADKIAQVKAGTLKEAHASWWGFDKNDATDALQNAINSGVSKLIVDNTGSDWVISKPIQLASNQEIVFEDGVVIQAMKGKFHGKNDSLFVARKKSNIKLIGQGNATFRMQRDDYDNKKLYEHSEWRHGIGLWDCENIEIRNLTVKETGGDGLYLGASGNGYNKNVLVENCNFVDNYRQGISVISAEDFTVRNCKLNTTKGTAPQAGIDYEPNTAGQRLVNCIIEDSELIGNKGAGLVVYAVNLKKTSKPISIVARNCKISGNSIGISSTVTKTPENPVTGTIVYENCILTHDLVRLRNVVLGSVTHVFKNCQIDATPAEGKPTPFWRGPITFTLDQEMAGSAIGGIRFENTLLKTDAGSPVKISLQGLGGVSDQISGELLIENKGVKTPFDFKSYLQQEQDFAKKLSGIAPATFKAQLMKAPAEGAPRKANNNFYTRDKFTFLQYAKAGDKITLNVTARAVYSKKTEVKLLDPNDKELNTYEIPYNNKPVPITFTAEQTGLYKIVRTQGFSQRIDINSAHPGNGYLLEPGIDFLPTNGKLYFEVPAGVKDFTIGVSSDSSADITLINALGEEVDRRDKANGVQLFSRTRTDASKSEIWAIGVANVVWAIRPQLYGDLAPIVSTNPATLLRVKD